MFVVVLVVVVLVVFNALTLRQHAGEHGAVRGEETEEAGPENVSQPSR